MFGILLKQQCQTGPHLQSVHLLHYYFNTLKTWVGKFSSGVVSQLQMLLADKDIEWLDDSSLVTALCYFYTAWNVVPPSPWLSTSQCTGTNDIPICPFSKDKQIVDSQIGVKSIPSRGGRYVSPYQTVSCLLH